MKPKYHEHDFIEGIAKRIKGGNMSILSSYSYFEIDEQKLLEVSKGNKKLVNEVQEIIAEQQEEGKSVGGFLMLELI